MSEKPVLFSEQLFANGSKLAIATLNSPKTLNSLNTEMVELLLAQLAQWQQDDSVSAVFIDGAGEKAFCAGGDVQALYASAVSNPGGPCTEAEHFFTQEYRLDNTIHEFAKPVITWGDGIVMGGGLGVFVGAGHRVVTETSRFAMPEVTIGLYPDVGGSYFLNHMPGQSGRFLALTGASFNATDALYVGIANQFIAREFKKDFLTALLNSDATDSGQHIEHVLQIFSKKSAEQLPIANVEPHQQEIDRLCAGDIYAVVEAFAAYETEDKWLSKAKKSIAHGSPLSVLLIDEQLRRSKSKSLSDVFKSELILSTNVVRYPEFAEGVRALLIDKDQNPSWQFKDINTIPTTLVNSFFEAPWPQNPLADL